MIRFRIYYNQKNLKNKRKKEEGRKKNNEKCFGSVDIIGI